jgi:hypothetical protein
VIDDSYRNHVGYRFQYWMLDDEPELTAAQKAAAYDQFAAEFEALPPHQEPHEGWADGMAYLCRRAARQHRGEPVGEWLPCSKRCCATQ